MVPSKEAPSRAGARKEAPDRSSSAAGNPGSLVNTAQPGRSAEPTTGSQGQAEPVAPAAYAFGQQVRELNVIIDGAAGTLITDQVAAFTAVRFGLGPKGTPLDGKPCFNVGDGWGRTVAAQRVIKAELQVEGLFVTFTDGYRALVPLAACRPSWRV